MFSNYRINSDDAMAPTFRSGKYIKENIWLQPKLYWAKALINLFSFVPRPEGRGNFFLMYNLG